MIPTPDVVGLPCPVETVRGPFRFLVARAQGFDHAMRVNALFVERGEAERRFRTVSADPCTTCAALFCLVGIAWSLAHLWPVPQNAPGARIIGPA